MSSHWFPFPNWNFGAHIPVAKTALDQDCTIFCLHGCDKYFTYILYSNNKKTCFKIVNINLFKIIKILIELYKCIS